MTAIGADQAAVVIIGSGAGGGTLANELCQRGIPCVLFEAGPSLDPAEFVNDEITMAARLTWADERSMSGSGSVPTSHSAPTCRPPS